MCELNCSCVDCQNYPVFIRVDSTSNNLNRLNKKISNVTGVWVNEIRIKGLVAGADDVVYISWDNSENNVRFNNSENVVSSRYPLNIPDPTSTDTTQNFCPPRQLSCYFGECTDLHRFSFSVVDLNGAPVTYTDLYLWLTVKAKNNKCKY